jgi:PII-like signaling protein
VFTYVVGKKLTVYVESAEQWQGGPLYSAIVQRCWERGIAGATVIRCEEGFGHRHVHHAARLWSLNDDLPVRVEIIETADRFPRVLEALTGMLTKGLTIVDDVQVVKEIPDEPGST